MRIFDVLFARQPHASLATLFDAYSTNRHFCGSALVALGDQLLLRRASGLANREHEVANRPETVFRIGSLTKLFTALLIMLLIEEERLSLDTPVSEYAPAVPQGDRIRVRDLLGNRSGLPDYIITEEYVDIANRHMSTEEMVAFSVGRPLLFEPGSDFGYSNTNWVLLTLIAERVTGESFEALLRARIFAPAGMVHSGYSWERPMIPHRASGYLEDGDGIRHASWIDESTMSGAGGIYSTVDDLWHWGQALTQGKIVQPAVLEQMWSPVSEQYGLGWELSRMHGRRVVGHSGGLPGYESDFAFFPDCGLTTIVLSNAGGAPMAAMTRAFSAAALGEPFDLPAAHHFVEVDPALLSAYAGSYVLNFAGRRSLMHLEANGSRLMLHITGLDSVALQALSETRFFGRPKGDVEFDFLRETDGTVRTINLTWSGRNLTAARVE